MVDGVEPGAVPLCLENGFGLTAEPLGLSVVATECSQLRAGEEQPGVMPGDGGREGIASTLFSVSRT